MHDKTCCGHGRLMGWEGPYRYSNLLIQSNSMVLRNNPFEGFMVSLKSWTRVVHMHISNWSWRHKKMKRQKAACHYILQLYFGHTKYDLISNDSMDVDFQIWPMNPNSCNVHN